MTDTAILVENISKRYRIGAKVNGHETFAGSLSDLVTQPVRNLKRLRSFSKFGDSEDDSENIIWALRDISFEVKKGEVVGIIGRNGAGKSTLLKILTRITEPTGGRATINGRVGSLLEVGTGFHPELTGRDNVYLNGAILGMTRKEIKGKFDEIVDFSGVEKFIDTPVKRYSSGMKVRLAFAVAAHLEPEILMVDEVLAVGDAEFQKKCLGKMSEVAESGRTVLFVSHNMGAITRLCTRALLIEGGIINITGSPSKVVAAYLSSGRADSSSWTCPDDQPPDSEAQLISARVLSMVDEPAPVVNFDSQFKMEVEYEVIRPIRNLFIVIRIADSIGNVVLESMDTDSTRWKGIVREPGHYMSVCKVPAKLLKPGSYWLSIVSFVERGGGIMEHYDSVLSFEVSQVGYDFNPGRLGVITPVLEWEVARRNGSASVAHCMIAESAK